MKKHLFTAICCFITITLFAQTPAKTFTIQGMVLDSATKAPLGFVTVAVTDEATKQPVKSNLTKEGGLFSLIGLPSKAYQLSLVYVGYRSVVIPIKGDGDFNAGNIIMSPASSKLKEVSVTAAKPLMKREVDRIAYDVQADPESKALSALDMMRKVPLLSVDGNDNIQLKGSGNYKILLNGKESAIVAKNPSDILKAMPGTNIEKIEVITTPPAKYDAEGLAGIINIITKKNADQGYSVSFNSRFNSIFGPGYNLNLTLKQGKFGIASYMGIGSQGNNTFNSGNNQTIFATNTNIVQTGTSSNKGYNPYGGAELSYEIDTLHLLTGSINIFGSHQDQGSMLTSNTAMQLVPIQAYTFQKTANLKSTGLDASLNYQIGFKHDKDKLLTLSYKFSYAPNSQFTDNFFTGRFNYGTSTYPDYRQYNNANNKDHTIQVDYAGKLNKYLNMELGGKAILRDNSSNYYLDGKDPATGQYITNNAQTNVFKYSQDIISVYNSYQLKLNKWTGKAGLRIEHTGISADFTSAGVSTAPSYNNLIPSVSILRNFTASSIGFGYTQRIQRPGISQLNPFVDRSTPPFVSTGNPSLKPELDNTFDITYSNFAKNPLNIDLSYAFSNNSIQNVSSLLVETYNNKKDTVTYTTYQNLGTNKTLGLNVNTNFTIGKRYTLSLNGQINHVWLSGAFNGGMYKNDGFTGNASSNMRYKFNNGFALSFNAGYFSGNVNLQGKSSDFIFNQFLLSKDLLNKKLTLAVVANNPYKKYTEFRSTINSADFYQTSYNQNLYRSFACRVNFRFGKLNSDIKKNQHGINNDDVKDAGKGNSSSGS